jgi:hypothetical protein
MALALRPLHRPCAVPAAAARAAPGLAAGRLLSVRAAACRPARGVAMRTRAAAAAADGGAASAPEPRAAARDASASAEAPAVALPRRRIAVFVEPSPFSHTSGMKNRFLNLLANLTEQGDEVRACVAGRGACGAGCGAAQRRPASGQTAAHPRTRAPRRRTACGRFLGVWRNAPSVGAPGAGRLCWRAVTRTLPCSRHRGF